MCHQRAVCPGQILASNLHKDDACSAGRRWDGDDRCGSRMSSPGRDLVRSKLAAPAPRAGLIPRVGLQALLQANLSAKLVLLDAPAGSGKTTLLAQWQATAVGDRVAWVALDRGDNDPTSFWIYVVEALRGVEPGVGAAARG